MPFINCRIAFQEGVTDADVYPDIKFRLTYQIVKKMPPVPSGPTDVPSLVPYSVVDPSKPQEATALVSPHTQRLGHWAGWNKTGKFGWEFKGIDNKGQSRNSQQSFQDLSKSPS